ncbi:sensor histidine kinase [Thiocapsa marina]|uniref:histidine kinase n=1 Tax=Thiocapsa marina 5811 TaxID=768671 RepID=F9U7X0_9GAMM|nr:ATP-binding protein [Thiocapsa marina]EGV19750.1 integral membrane sensor signal transduction histidine kinase [Thiocapsa marina 5811]
MTNHPDIAAGPPSPATHREGKSQPGQPGHPHPTWLALRWLFLFRLVVLIGLILLFSPTAMDPLITPANAVLAWNVLIFYAILVLLSGLALYARRPSRGSQVHLATYIDIIAFTFLMHAAGGAASGIGILIGVAVAAGALLMEGRLALLFASLAALAVLTEQVYSDLSGSIATTSYTQAGLLGSIFFTVALLAHVLYRRVREAEAMAARRTVDIANLTKLNAFIIANLETGVLAVDGERHLRLTNRAALELLDVDAVKPGSALGEFSPEVAQWLETQVQDPAPEGTIMRVGERELRATLKLLGDYRASGALIYLRDNQELTREAQQLKLAALGTLTASIAHNIRNPLSAITHASQLFSDGKDLPEDDRHLLDIIQRNSARIDETVRSVLQLSRRDRMDPVSLDAALWIEDFAEEFRETHRLAPERLTLEITFSPDPVEVDPRHLHQIVSNLCENALIHGGYGDKPAHIEIRLLPGGEAADRPVIEIADEGPGIDAKTARDIFNPFFTTKTSGTGLGLYIARELAETNGIHLTYEAAEPHGSRFRLHFAR